MRVPCEENNQLTVRTHDGLVYQSAKVLLLLLLVASDHDGHGAQTVGLDRRHDASAAVGHLLGDQTAVHRAEPHPSVLLRDVEVHQAGGVGLLQDVPRVLSSLVIMSCIRDDLVLGELLREIQVLLLLSGDGEVVASVHTVAGLAGGDVPHAGPV